MEPIFYDKAAKLLEVRIDTLAHAVSRGELTRVGEVGKRPQLIKEQVDLFIGTNPRTGKKKRISYNSLSESEQALWHQYARESGTPAPNVVSIDKVREIARQEFARQELNRLERQAQEAREKEERYRKEYPFLQTAY